MKTKPISDNAGKIPLSALLGIADCGLHRRTPYGMTNVSKTQLSIARFYGALQFNGDSYTYMADTDELIRNDVLAWKSKQARKRKTTPRG